MGARSGHEVNAPSKTGLQVCLSEEASSTLFCISLLYCKDLLALSLAGGSYARAFTFEDSGMANKLVLF